MPFLAQGFVKFILGLIPFLNLLIFLSFFITPVVPEKRGHDIKQRAQTVTSDQLYPQFTAQVSGLVSSTNHGPHIDQAARLIEHTVT